MIIAVDIDGILTNETEGHDYPLRTPNMENIAKVNDLSLSHIIVLYTARFEQDRAVTEIWLSRHNVSHDLLVMGKLQYDILIDDKSQSNFDNVI